MKTIVTDDKGANAAAVACASTVELVEIPPGPFILVFDAGQAQVDHGRLQEVAASIYANLCSRVEANITLLVLENGAKLELVDEEKMRAHGWVRA